MQLRLDPRSREPIYTQIVEQVKQMVASGLLRPGDQLPTVREVAATLCINFNTVARAYRLLHDEGVISSQQGRGTYVLQPEAAAGHDAGRHARLLALVRDWLAQADREGFAADEVAAAWAQCFDRWAGSEEE